MLETKNLTKSYPLNGVEVQALRGVNLGIESGEFVAIVGPSGCGKSTLLSIMGGLMFPTSGQIFLEGEDLNAHKEREKAQLRRDHIGYVFQSFNLLADLTAAENVEFPMVLANMPESERRSWVQELLKRVGLSDKADHLPDELSGGQKQRVAIARALANRPDIILADEPTGNLDSATAAEIIDLLIGLNRKDSVTLVMVTHSPDDAASAHRSIHLRDGQIEN
ncbi:MAG TPA: macrolide ABC transporter ATP-binding protein [Anaerolineaceae bacterium]|nr:macrolide ABC transporter ATP-binding protein [Anaerolineaceae bacterium]